MDVSDIDLTQVPDQDTFEPVPDGEYVCAVKHTEGRETKAGDGKYLQVELQIVEGPYAGRLLWDRLNLFNPSEKAQNIARRQFRSLWNAAGLAEDAPTKDTSMLHGKIVQTSVVVSPARGQYGPSNDIKGYTAKGGKPYFESEGGNPLTPADTPF